MIKITAKQKEILKTSGLDIELLYGEILSMRHLSKSGSELFNQVATILNLPLNYSACLAGGYFADLDRFNAYLSTSKILKLALQAGQTTPAIRKLVFELLYWVQSPIGVYSPNTIISTWRELIDITRGALKAQLTAAELSEWNMLVEECQMAAGLKL